MTRTDQRAGVREKPGLGRGANSTWSKSVILALTSWKLGWVEGRNLWQRHGDAVTYIYI